MNRLRTSFGFNLGKRLWIGNLPLLDGLSEAKSTPHIMPLMCIRITRLTSLLYYGKEKMVNPE